MAKQIYRSSISCHQSYALHRMERLRYAAASGTGGGHTVRYKLLLLAGELAGDDSRLLHRLRHAHEVHESRWLADQCVPSHHAHDGRIIAIVPFIRGYASR